MMQKKYFTLGFFLSILLLFPSCKGQGYKDTKSTAPQQGSIGKIVSELDSKATLMYQDKGNNYWFAATGKGVYKYDGKDIVLFTSKDGLCAPRIIGIQEDKIGNIYFDTPEGVCKFDGQQFTTLKVIENNTTKNEWKSEPDDLWFRMGWDKNGPYRFDGENLYQLEFPKTKLEDEFYSKYPNVTYNPYGIYSMYKDSKGYLWFGTSSLGIYIYDGEKGGWLYEQHLTETPEGGAFGIRSIIEDKEGYFWICNTSYKYKILPHTTESNKTNAINYKRETGIESNGKDVPYFMSIIEGDNGDLWMTSNSDGVLKNNGKELIHYPINSDEKDIFSTTIYMDNQGILWLGTYQNGLYKFNGKSFERFRLTTK